MLVCITCGSRFGAHAHPLAAGGCPLCGDELVELHDPPLDDAEPVHADLARTLREHLLGVGA